MRRSVRHDFIIRLDEQTDACELGDIPVIGTYRSALIQNVDFPNLEQIRLGERRFRHGDSSDEFILPVSYFFAGSRFGQVKLVKQNSNQIVAFIVETIDCGKQTF